MVVAPGLIPIPCEGYMEVTTGYRPPATGHQLNATGYRPPATGHRLQATSVTGLWRRVTHTGSCERVLRLAVPPCVVCPVTSPDRFRCRPAYRGTLCRTGTAHRTAHRTVQRTPSGRPGRPKDGPANALVTPPDGLQDAHRTPSGRPRDAPGRSSGRLR